MKIIFVLIFALATTSAYFDYEFFGIKLNNQNNKKPELDPSNVLFDGTYETSLDHFSPRDDRTLQLKYQGNKGFFEENGPVFINVNVGGGSKMLHRGLVYDLAKEVKGAIIQANNRYFGSNMWELVTLMLIFIVCNLQFSIFFQQKSHNRKSKISNCGSSVSRHSESGETSQKRFR